MAEADVSSHLLDASVELLKSSFFSGTSRQAFRQYEHLHAMLQDTEPTRVSDQEDNERLKICYRRTVAFSERLAPYFETINAFVPLKSEWPGWLWGCIGFIFRRGRAYMLFLEEITDMFESMAMNLPDYQTQGEEFLRKVKGVGMEHVAHIMSFVYTDVAHFCRAVHALFSRHTEGGRSRDLEDSFSSRSWRPLDIEFHDLRRRLKKHQKWLTEELTDQNYASRIRRRTDLIIYLQHTERVDQYQAHEDTNRQVRRIKHVERWLSTSETSTTPAFLKARVFPGTCSWFLALPEYRLWKTFDGGQMYDKATWQSNWAQRVLFVQAKVGFGKTMLSGMISDDLTSSTQNVVFEDGSVPTSAFFSFDSTYSRNSNGSIDALRSIATQLIRVHQSRRITQHAIALIIRSTSNGQHFASFEDIITTLRLLLLQFPTFLVVDGIDHCSDTERFLVAITGLCMTSDCRVLLLSRTNIDVFSRLECWKEVLPNALSLHASHNLSDIQAFLNGNLGNSTSRGHFGEQATQRSYLQEISHLADGNFLWTTLFVEYLKSPWISPEERRLSLEQANLLGRLESLYNAILNLLSRRPTKEKKVAGDSFRWLTQSIKPLDTKALHTALAITSGQVTSEDQYLLNFSTAVSQITYSLVKVNATGGVDFIHHSVKEYLRSPDCRSPEFSVHNECITHAELASRCLSYLTYDVPKRPLRKLQPYDFAGSQLSTGASLRTAQTGRSGNSGYRSVNPADADMMVVDDVDNSAFDRHLPFLRYAALFWPIHLTKSLTSPLFSSEHIAIWLPLLSQFLSDRLAVTVWVEASWRYHLPPNVARLVPLISAVLEDLSPQRPESRELNWVILGLRHLREALNELRNDYGVTLDENPSLIWQWNIQAATDSMFWPVWDERRGVLNGSGS